VSSKIAFGVTKLMPPDEIRRFDCTLQEFLIFHHTNNGRKCLKIQPKIRPNLERIYYTYFWMARMALGNWSRKLCALQYIFCLYYFGCIVQIKLQRIYIVNFSKESLFLLSNVYCLLSTRISFCAIP
jgi:hypothetical protein